MRLLNARTFELETFFDNIPPYAILCHCWENEEVIFSDLVDLEAARKKKGFAKIQKTCELAVADGLDYAWIDSSCIDKSSSAELSEAINSMFAWYRNCDRCYAYLADVEVEGAFMEGHRALHSNTFPHSKWFKRAWTLQELLAPSNYPSGAALDKIFSRSAKLDPGMKFYSRDWQLLGNKANMGTRISKITGIPIEYLEGQSLETASISMRMSWAADRQATRSEDIAYSLLGIFDVNMPLLYGEGKVKAFRRLQEEIMKISEDETLFAWESSQFGTNQTTGDVLAAGPNDFREARDLIPFASDDPVAPYGITHRGLRIWQTLFHTLELDSVERDKLRPLRSPVMIWSGLDTVWGILRCHVVHDFQHFVVFPLRHLSGNVYLRDISTSVSLIPFGSIPATAFPREIYIRNPRISTIPKGVRRQWGFLIRKFPEGIVIRQCYPKEAWSAKDDIVQGKADDAGPSSWHATLELNFSLITKSGQIAKYMLFLALGCRKDGIAEQPRAWCHIDDTIWRYGTANLESFHHAASSKPQQHEVGRFRAGNVTRVDLSLWVSITPVKVLSQDMFVVDLHYAELEDHLDTTTRSSHQQLLPPSTSYSGPPMHDAAKLVVPGV
jgi:hypothetical protein